MQPTSNFIDCRIQYLELEIIYPLAESIDHNWHTVRL